MKEKQLNKRVLNIKKKRSLNLAVFYCKVHRKRLEQKERETHDIAECEKKKKRRN